MACRLSSALIWLTVCASVALAVASPPATGDAPGPTQRTAGALPEPLFPILVRSRWGFVDRSGRVLVSPRFESTLAMEAEREAFSRAGRENTDDLFMAQSVVAETTAIVAVKFHGNWGFVDHQGQLLPLRFDEVDPFSEGLAPVRQGTRWGFVSGAGLIAVPLLFDQAEAFQGGAAIVGQIVDQEWRYGVINAAGHVLVKARFESIRPADSVFHDNRALITLFDKKGFVSRAGNIAVPPMFDAALPFSEGLAAVTRGDRTGYIDTTGHMVILPRWWSAYRFSRGRAVVAVGTERGYIDRSGVFVAQPQFTDAQAFGPDDRAVAWKGPTKGWVDLSGHWTPIPFHELQRLDDSLSVGVVEHHTGLVRRSTGAMIRQYLWDEPGAFREGLSEVRSNGRSGFIDQDGRVVIPLRFRQVGSFDHGLCKAVTRDTLGYIDRSGAWVWASRFR